MNTILLVDDDDYVINGLLRHVPWKDMGVQIVGSASDGQDALDKYAELQPDFIITDIYMPLMDGFELIEAIHAINPAVPVVILSGYDDLANARKAVSSGVHHFLLKPPSIAEIEFVVREVIQLLNESEERDKLLDSYLQQQTVVRKSMKDAFFRDLLATRYRQEELPSDRIEFMGLPKEASIQVLTLSLIRSDAAVRRDEREWQLLRFGAGNIVREMLGLSLCNFPCLSAEVLEYSDQEFIVIFMSNQPIDGQLRALIRNQSTAILDNILQYMKLSVLAGLGSVRDGYHLLMDSFMESRIAVEIAEMNEWNRVYVYQKESAAEPGRPVSLDTVRGLHDVIFQKRWLQTNDSWSQLRSELEGGNSSLPVCKGICSSIVSSLWTAWQSLKTSEDEVIPGLDELLLQLNRCGSSKALLDWMDRIVSRFIAQFREDQLGKKSHGLVDRVIKDFIEKCYHDNLSLEQISAKLHVNRNYLSQLFKRVTGEPFVTYVNKYRIQKAIELIGTGKYMVYEISEKVGFQNSTYFSQVFKSITGCSPSEYDR